MSSIGGCPRSSSTRRQVANVEGHPLVVDLDRAHANLDARVSLGLDPPLGPGRRERPHVDADRLARAARGARLRVEEGAVAPVTCVESPIELLAREPPDRLAQGAARRLAGQVRARLLAVVDDQLGRSHRKQGAGHSKTMPYAKCHATLAARRARGPRLPRSRHRCQSRANLAGASGREFARFSEGTALARRRRRSRLAKIRFSYQRLVALFKRAALVSAPLAAMSLAGCGPCAGPADQIFLIRNPDAETQALIDACRAPVEPDCTKLCQAVSGMGGYASFAHCELHQDSNGYLQVHVGTTFRCPGGRRPQRLALTAVAGSAASGDWVGARAGWRVLRPAISARGGFGARVRDAAP